MSLSQILNASIGGTTHEETQVVGGFESIEQEVGLQVAENEMVETENALVALEQTAEGLESLETEVSASMEDGGLDSRQAGLLAVACSNAMAPFGGQMVKPMPGAESFDAAGGREAATRAGLESLKESAKAIWDAIVEFLQKAKAAVMKWFNENIAKVGRLKKAAESLAEKAGDKQGSPDKSKLAVTRPEYLGEGGEASATLVGLTPAGLEAVAKFLKDAAAKQEAEAKDAEAVVDAVEKNGDLKDDAAASAWAKSVVDSINSYVANVGNGGKALSGDKRFTAGDGESLVVSQKPIAGSIGIVVKKPKADSGKVATITFAGAVKPKKAKEVKADALNGGDISALCEGVVKVCDAILDAKEILPKVDKFTDEVIKAGKGVVKDMDEDEVKGETKRTVKAALKAMNTMARNRRAPIADMVKNMTVTAASAFSFANASFKNIKEK